MKKTVVALALFSCCAAASAAETYTIDPNHTHVTFSFQHLGFSTFDGKIPARSGTIVLDRTQKTGRIDITFDLGALSTAVPDFDEHLRGPDFFEVEKHPTATFKSSKITFDADAPAQITGDLTIKDISKPVTLKVTHFKCGPHPMMNAPACGANASAQITRSDFDLGMYAPAVSDELMLAIEVEAVSK